MLDRGQEQPAWAPEAVRENGGIAESSKHRIKHGRSELRISMQVTFEEYLEKHGHLVYTNVGTSMLPLLKQGRDLFIITAKDGQRFDAGDVVLYRRPPNQYVLHRVVQVRPEDYVILGDNCVNREYGIRDRDILGVMTAFIRKGKEHRVTDRGYRLYTRVWLRTEKPRTFLIKLRARAGGLLRRARRVFLHASAVEGTSFPATMDAAAEKDTDGNTETRTSMDED